MVFTLAHQLRSSPEASHIPIVFLSATYVTPDDKEFAISLGVVRFMVKPIDTQELLLTVAEILTSDLPTFPPPLGDYAFYQGYRERLENKHRHKNTQITRTECLLRNLPLEQKPTFEALLAKSQEQRKEIQLEHNEVFRILNQFREA